MDIMYTAPPTCAQFMKSDGFGRMIAGPVGSGKTTACIFELLRRACDQAPSVDGLRYTRFAIVRQTLRSLIDTVLKDITSWLKDLATYKVMDKTIIIEFGDVRSEWLLIPLDDVDDQRRLLSMQLTGGWLSEAIEMSVDILAPLAGRCGRYPSGIRGVPTWMGLIADTNMPTEGTEWHKFMSEPPPDWAVFIQPGGLSAEAENLDWLTQTPATMLLPPGHPDRLAQGRTYYERLARNSNPDWVKRYVHAMYGDDPSGSAVFKESFVPKWHGVDDLTPVAGQPLIIGQDFGRDPWSVICQMDHRGRLLVLEEVAAEDIGLELHIQRALKPRLYSERYQGRAFAVVGDPSGAAKSSLYEINSFDMLKSNGLVAFPAPTNDIEPRIAAIEAFLNQSRGPEPAFVIDKTRCPVLFRALSGGYRYGRTKAGQRKPLPDKNEFSHPIDSLQYAALAAHGGMVAMIASRLAKGGRRRGSGAPRVSAAGWT